MRCATCPVLTPPCQTPSLDPSVLPPTVWLPSRERGLRLLLHRPHGHPGDDAALHQQAQNNRRQTLNDRRGRLITAPCGEPCAGVHLSSPFRMSAFSQPRIRSRTRSLRERFHLRQDGALVRTSTGDVATFTGPHNRVLVRLCHEGFRRRIAAGKVAWVLQFGWWPTGPVLPRDGDHDNFSAGNLIMVKYGPSPFGERSPRHGAGGRASSLERRNGSAVRLLSTLAEHPDASLTLPQISRLAGSPESCTCTRLGKLAKRGLVCGPRCNAAERWRLLQAGREIAVTERPLIDPLDRRILMVIARSPVRLMALAHVADVCRLTARRRIDRLTAQG